MKDPDTTIYLFGTFHALDGKSAWFNDEVKTAFDQSEEVVLELPPMEDKAALQPIIMKYALDTSGKPLSEKLSPAAKEKYAKALGELGAPPTAFDKFKPFFAALTLVMVKRAEARPDRREGRRSHSHQGRQGRQEADQRAGDRGFPDVPVREPAPKPSRSRCSSRRSRRLDESTAIVRGNEQALDAGRCRRHGQADERNERTIAGTSTNCCLTDRNANWADWIDQRLDKPGVVFVGVGAGHLGGKDSVQDLLAKRGISSARYKGK